MAHDEAALARRRGKERSTGIWFKLKEGDTTFRILPTPASKTTQKKWIEYGLHREIGTKKAQVRCGKDPMDNHQGECYLCDVVIPKLRKLGKHERADLIEPRDVLAIQVAKLDDSEGKEVWTGPFIFTPAQTVGNQILTNILGHRKRDYTDPVKGYNITVTRTGTGRNDTRYNMLQIDSDPSEVPEELIKKLKPFSDLKEIPLYSKAKQKAAYEGRDLVDEDEEDEEEGNEPAERDADEEELEGEESEEEEEAPPPRRPVPTAASVKTGKKKPAPEPEEEDEAEMSEDELEELDNEQQEEPEEEEAEEEEAEEEEAEEEEEEPSPPPKKKSKAPIPMPKKPGRR